MRSSARSIELLALLGIYSDSCLDHREHTITTCYVAEAKASLTVVDDAKNCQKFSVD